MNDYDGPERRNGISLQTIHRAILDTQQHVERNREEQIATRVKVEAIQCALRRGERRLEEYDRRIRKNSENLSGCNVEIDNLKIYARKSGGVSGGIAGGVMAALVQAIKWMFRHGAG